MNKLLLKALLLCTLCLHGYGGTANATDTLPRLAMLSDTPLPQATEAEVGLPVGTWKKLVEVINAQNMPIDQISIMVQGKQVAALHRNGFGINTMHDLRSATKSITALLVGIAIDKGLITNLDTPIDRYFPEWPSHPSRARYQALTIRHLLTMRSGLDCDDWNDTAGNEEKMYLTPNWIQFFQRIPAIGEPGAAFSYCTAGAVILGEIVARASAKRLPNFAQTYLFDPLGIHNVVWADAGSSITDSGGHLRVTLDSMLKIGELVRMRGAWDGKQVISSNWLDQILRPATQNPYPPQAGLKAQYGMLWWLEPVRDGVARSYQARGNGGQYIINVPEAGLVVAVTGNAYNQSPAQQLAAFGLIDRILMPALLPRAKQQ